ncbi:PhoX family phosphatase [Nocardioides lentus]|uniref:PhoX family phosphatase n=1 Tax=Nocardioides lentus TaxID=338077 RepID=A0ABP5AXH9_9ACTN
MSTSPATRTLLPLLPDPMAEGHSRASRSAMTCTYRCDDACFKPAPNTTATPHVRDEIAKVVQRRSVLKGAAVGTGALALAGGVLSSPVAAAPGAGRGAGGAVSEANPSADLATTPFRTVPPNRRDAVVVPDGFTNDVVIRWGDGVLPGAPRFDAYDQSVAAAKKQFGYNCDYVGLLDHPSNRARSVLVVNHEYTTEPAMFPAEGYTDAEKIEIEMYNHGISVVEVKRGATPGSWNRVAPRNAPLNRRINVDTTFFVTGPAAGSDRLKTTADPSGTRVKGTLNNCAGGMTPWGTVLSGEENFNQYFAGTIDPEYAASYARYGISATGSRNWGSVDPRFDLGTEPNEPNRFGWIVEVDPRQPKASPRKHTMLGRFKHEGANVIISREGYAVAYMGDDERGDYLYKFVSKRKMAKGRSGAARDRNKKLLTEGTLYVARLVGDGAEDGTYDGTGRWIPLCSDTESFVDGWTVEDILVDTRLAADAVAPTRMDRPEDVEPNLVNGRVYAALTNNSQRGTRFPADEANPITTSQVRDSLDGELTPAAGNNNGYVLEMLAARGDHAAPAFTWNLLLVCGDPEAQETYFGGYPKEEVSPISCPDNVAFDTKGNLWISTDGNRLGSNDGIFRVPVAGAERGNVQQFLTVPRGAEACGPLLTDGDRALWTAVQHPGELDGSSFDEPGSTWPHTDDFPRPSVVVTYRRG